MFCVSVSIYVSNYTNDLWPRAGLCLCQAWRTSWSSWTSTWSLTPCTGSSPSETSTRKTWAPWWRSRTSTLPARTRSCCKPWTSPRSGWTSTSRCRHSAEERRHRCGNEVAVGLCVTQTSWLHCWNTLTMVGGHCDFILLQTSHRDLDGRASSCSYKRWNVTEFLITDSFSLFFRSLSCFTSRWAALEYFSGQTRLRLRRLRKRKVKVEGVMMVISGVDKWFACTDARTHF